MIDFRLSPQEDFVFGVQMRGATLSFGPSGSDVTAASIAGVVMVGLGLSMALSSWSGSTVNGYAVENPEAMRVLGMLTIAVAVGFVVTAMLAGVRADEEGIVLRRLWQRRRLPWSSIAAVRVEETAPKRWRWSAGPNILQWRALPVSSWSVGVVELGDGTLMRLPGFVSAAAGQGLSGRPPTATELKVQALARFKAHVTDDPPAVVSTAGGVVGEVPFASTWTIPAYLAASVGLWLVVSWAVGTLVSPGFLLIGMVVSLVRARQRHRLG